MLLNLEIESFYVKVSQSSCRSLYSVRENIDLFLRRQEFIPIWLHIKNLKGMLRST